MLVEQLWKNQPQLAKIVSAEV